MDKIENCTVYYHDVKHPRLEFKTGKLVLILPKNFKNHEALIQKHQKWIQRKLKIIEEAVQEAERKEVSSRDDTQLKELVNNIIKKYKQELKVNLNKIFFRKMKTKWASYSRKNNLTVNKLLKYLPTNLIEYVLYHELAHYIEKKHNQKFWKIIKTRHPDYENKEKELLTYWFIIQNKLQ